MNQQAKIARHYLVRLSLIALLALAGGLFFLYDGFVRYPATQARYEKYEEVRKAYPEDYNAQWVKVAQDNGWSSDVPEYKSDWDIRTQKIIAAILIPVGLFMLGVVLRNRGRWIAMDEQGLSDQAGRRVAFDAIREIDDSRWQRKGIAVVHYQADGQSGRFVLDDWKFDRAAVTAMFKHLKQLTSPETPETPDAPQSQEAQEPV